MGKSLKDAIAVQQGDITQMDVEAIVNAANNDLRLGGGVAGAIRRAGGTEIQRQCDEIGRIPIGEAAITGAGEMKARCVIHAASMSLGAMTSAEALRDSTRNSLLRAKEKGLKTIAFPAVGAGIAGFPLERCAQIMLEEAAAHLEGRTSVEKIYFVLFSPEALAAFENRLNKMI